MEPKTFVVPLDGSEYSERALPVAASLAERIGGGLLLLRTESSNPLRAREYLEEVADRRFTCPVETIACADRLPARAILGSLHGAKSRVVCMTTHGRGRIAWTVLGSVAEEVVRRTDQPLILVGPNCRPDAMERSAPLVVATAGDGEGSDLASSCVVWSEMLGLDRRVAVVAHPLDVESAQHEARLAARLGSEYGVDPTSVILRRDEYPAGALVDLAERMPAALVAMGSHGRHGMKRMALGSVTMSVVHHAPCPVLAIPLEHRP